MKISLFSRVRNSGRPNTISIRRKGLTVICETIICSFFVTTSVVAFASVESSLQAVQEKLVGTLLPMGAMCGLAIAGLSFVAGHANARQHLFYAIVGAIVGFGAESIVSLIQSLIH
jgi:hypothetical protein